jgi:cysteine desulfurase
MNVNTPTTPAAIQDQYQSGPVTLLTLDTPFGKPNPEMFLLEHEDKKKVLPSTATSVRIRRLIRIGKGYPGCSRLVALTGTVLGVGSITDQQSLPSSRSIVNFQSDSPLHPAAFEFLSDAFGQGWADPKKSSFASKTTAILLNQAKEQFSAYLGVRVDQLFPIADFQVGFYLGTMGILKPDSVLHYSGAARSEIFAIARTVPSHKLPVSSNGAVGYLAGKPQDVLAWQSVNSETGVQGNDPKDFHGKIFVDATSAVSSKNFPDNWSTALWDSRAWQGPAGLAIFVLQDKSVWSNPFPHASADLEGYTQSTFSIPLTIASAIALEAHSREAELGRESLIKMNMRIRDFLATQLGNVDIAGEIDTESGQGALPHLLTFSLLYVDAAILQERLEVAGFSVDSGSACSATNMEHSHVLAAMGLLTHGNVRLTIRSDHSLTKIELFLETLKSIVEELRTV